MPTSTPEHVIEARGICRAYGGCQALTDFSLNLPRGSIYGFLGRNGAGKTTALKILAGLTRPDAGTVRVFGGDPFTFTISQGGIDLLVFAICGQLRYGALISCRILGAHRSVTVQRVVLAVVFISSILGVVMLSSGGLNRPPVYVWGASLVRYNAGPFFAVVAPIFALLFWLGRRAFERLEAD